METSVERLGPDCTERTFSRFTEEIEGLLAGAATTKGYSPNGVNGDNPLYEFVAHLTGGPDHALGEIIYKVVRYKAKRNPEDLLKVACWAYLVWRNER